MNIPIFVALLAVASIIIAIILDGYMPPFGRQRQKIKRLLRRSKQEPNFGDRDFRIEYGLKVLDANIQSSRQRRAYERLCDEYSRFVVDGILNHLEVYIHNGQLKLGLSKLLRLRELYSPDLGGPEIYLSPVEDDLIERVDRAEKLLLELLAELVINASKANPRDVDFQSTLRLASRCGLTYYPPNWNDLITDYVESPEYEDYVNLGDFNQYTPTNWLYQAATALTESNVQKAAEIVAICVHFSEEASEVPGLPILVAQLALLLANDRAAQNTRP